MTIEYYPAFIRLTGRLCVVVGGGKVAERKVLALLRAGARVTVVSPALTAGLRKNVLSGAIVHRARNYRRGDLKGAFLVIAATADEEVNRRVHADAPCLVNVVDRPEFGNFIVPSVVARGPLTFAVSTSGRSPSMARTIRREIEKMYGSEFGVFLRHLEGIRRRLKDEVASTKERGRILREVASPEVVETLRGRGLRAARDRVRRVLEHAKQRT